jgi:hypothetical protein
VLTLHFDRKRPKLELARSGTSAAVADAADMWPLTNDTAFAVRGS